MKKKLWIAGGAVLALLVFVPFTYGHPDGNGDVVATRDVVAGRAVKGAYAIYSNGKADGGDTVYESAGFDTWHLDNLNGQLRFFRPGSVMATITPSGFNIAGNLQGRQIILNNGAANGGPLRFMSSTGESHFLRNAGGTLQFYNAGGTNLTLSSTGNAHFRGEISSSVVEIRGAGNDVAEGFKIDGLGQEVKPGMVVAISAAKPGEMELSSKPYQRTVAGIISGAGDRRVGIQLGNSEEVRRGELTPVALTGQVWCYVDTSMNEITPGDLLTTSPKPGHAMKVLDYGQAQGAVIGKAMSALAQGEEGMVLVLVSLQ